MMISIRSLLLLVVTPLCLLIVVYEVFGVIDRAGQPFWLIAFLAVIVSVGGRR